MTSHVSGYLSARREKGLISNTFCHAKWEYGFSVRPIGCTPIYLVLEQVTLIFYTKSKS